ncbi:MAG: 50S ribosomal protein L35 [Actinomycetota bacterium]|nr:50S ribosomal protein L35 [Actinomycetota bacterium]
MPKQKTHRGAAKRLQVTGTGKISRRNAWRGHNRHKKSAKRWRRVQGESVLTGGNARRAGRLLGR